MIQLKNVHKVVPQNNYVLLKISSEGGANKIKLPGTDLEFDSSFNPEKHVDVIGKVTKVPDRLTFFSTTKRGHKENTMMWRTLMELQKDDMVYVDYLEVLSALGPFFNPMGATSDSRVIITPDKDLYVFVHYSRIYAKILKKGLRPINGYVVLDGTKGTMIKRVMDHSMRYFREVLYTGAKNTFYTHSKYYDVDVEPGDFVAFRGGAFVKIENDMHQKLDRPMIVVQRRDIYAKTDKKTPPVEL